MQMWLLAQNLVFYFMLLRNNKDETKSFFSKKKGHFSSISASFCNRETRNYNFVRFWAFFSLHNMQAQVLEHISDFNVDQ
jgi:hypothetical protein